MKQSWTSTALRSSTVGEPGPPERVGERVPHVGHHVGVLAAALELVGEGQADGPVAPAGDAGGAPAGDRLGVVADPGIGGEHHARAPVGDLAAVGAPGAAGHDRVHVVIVGEARLAELPAAGLGVRVVLGVAHRDLRERVEVLVVEAVPAVVLVGHVGEALRPHVLGAALVPDPARRAEVLGGGVARHRALELHPDHQRGLVAAGLELGHRREDRDAPGGARRFVAGGGQAPEVLVDRRRHGPEVALAGEQLAEGVADVDGLDVGGPDPGVGERLADHLGGEPVERLALPAEVAREVALVAAQHPDPLSAHSPAPVGVASRAVCPRSRLSVPADRTRLLRWPGAPPRPPARRRPGGDRRSRCARRVRGWRGARGAGHRRHLLEHQGRARRVHRVRRHHGSRVRAVGRRRARHHDDLGRPQAGDLQPDHRGPGGPGDHQGGRRGQQRGGRPAPSSEP